MLPVLQSDRIREKLIKDGVKDLRKWIFPHVNEKNIFTDLTYSYYFEIFLKRNKGLNKDIDAVINKLLFDVKYSIKDM